jgi:hypothetical protein
MARRSRVQFPVARYHVINRGNFQHPVFASAGATQAFENALGGGKTLGDAGRDSKGAPWKVSLARRLHTAVNAPHRWIAETLKMGAASSVRAYLSQTSRLATRPVGSVAAGRPHPGFLGQRLLRRHLFPQRPTRKTPGRLHGRLVHGSYDVHRRESRATVTIARKLDLRRGGVSGWRRRSA